MSEEQFERDLHSTVERMMAEPASPALRARVSEVLASPRPRRSPWFRFAPLATGLAATVVVVVVGFLAMTPRSATGPAPLVGPTSPASPAAAILAPSASPLAPLVLPPGIPPSSWTRVPDAPVLLVGGIGSAISVAPDGTFVAIESAEQRVPVVLRSTDGVTWTVGGSFPPNRDARVFAMTRAGDLFVAVGEDVSSGAVTGAAWTSTDGITWQRVPDQPAFASGPVDRITAGPAGIMAVRSLDFGTPIFSPDGTTWSEAPIGSGLAKVNGVTATDAGFAAVGSVEAAAAAWTSSDGQHWQRARFPDGSDATAYLTSVAAQGSRLVALGGVPAPGDEPIVGTQTGPAAWLSTDGGVTWTQTGTPSQGSAPDLSPSSFPRLYALSGGFAALGSGGQGRFFAVWTSVDGTTWQQASPKNEPEVWGDALAVSGGQAVIAGRNVGTGMGGDRSIFWTGVIGGVEQDPRPSPASVGPIVLPSGAVQDLPAGIWGAAPDGQHSIVGGGAYVLSRTVAKTPTYSVRSVDLATGALTTLATIKTGHNASALASTAVGLVWLETWHDSPPVGGAGGDPYAGQPLGWQLVELALPDGVLKTIASGSNTRIAVEGEAAGVNPPVIAADGYRLAYTLEAARQDAPFATRIVVMSLSTGAVIRQIDTSGYVAQVGLSGEAIFYREALNGSGPASVNPADAHLMLAPTDGETPREIDHHVHDATIGGDILAWAREDATDASIRTVSLATGEVSTLRGPSMTVAQGQRGPSSGLLVTPGLIAWMVQVQDPNSAWSTELVIWQTGQSVGRVVSGLAQPDFAALGDAWLIWHEQLPLPGHTDTHALRLADLAGVP